jgi:L-ribulose-5-phosphate 3-epimerase
MKKYLLGLYEKAMPDSLSWVEKLLAAKKAGFDFVEMSIDETEERLARLNMDAAWIGEVRAAMQSTGIPVRSICLSGHRKFPLGCPDEGKQQRSLEIMQNTVKLAAVLGVRIIQLAGYDVYYEQGTDKTRADFAANLKSCADMAAEEGILMGFETMETPFMDTTAKAMRYVREIDSPYLGVYPDVGNITNAAMLYGGDVVEDLESGRGHLVAVHLKETVPGRYREVPFGTGQVDFAKVIRKTWELGVRRYVVEFWHLDGQDYTVELVKANRFMRGCFIRAAGAE